MAVATSMALGVAPCVAPSIAHRSTLSVLSVLNGLRLRGKAVRQLPLSNSQGVPFRARERTHTQLRERVSVSASGLASRGRRARISVQCDYLCELQCSDTRPTRPGERHTHLTHSRYTSLGSTPPSGAGSWCKWPTSWRDRRVSFRHGSSDAPSWTCRRSCRSGTGPSRSRRWTRVVAWRAACPCVATPSAAAAARCRPAADAHTRVSGGRAVGRVRWGGCGAGRWCGPPAVQ